MFFSDNPFSDGPYSGVGAPSGGVHFPDLLRFQDAWPSVQESTITNPFLGVDGQSDPVRVDFEHDSPHVLINAGTGGGKSTIVRSIVAQHCARGGLAVILDYKQVSHRWAFGLGPNLIVATTLPDIGNALIHMGTEVHNRNAVVRTFPGAVEDAPVGPRILVVFEELNATMGLLKELDRLLPEGAYTASDGFKDVVFMGRAAKMHLVATAQLASRRAAGGAEILANFNCKIMVRYDETAWRWLIGKAFQFPPQEPGRGMVCQGGKAVKTQFLAMSEAEARSFVLHSPHARNVARSLSPSGLPQVWADAERRGLGV